MSREVRRVPRDWKHPVDKNGQLLPLLDGYAAAIKEWADVVAVDGLQEATEYFGRAPDANDYMPEWSADEADHLMMYETTTEGTPISPAFKTPEELARWLADNRASAFGSQTATYEHWLRMIRRGSSVASMVLINGQMKSGVAAVGDK